MLIIFFLGNQRAQTALLQWDAALRADRYTASRRVSTEVALRRMTVRADSQNTLIEYFSSKSLVIESKRT